MTPRDNSPADLDLEAIELDLKTHQASTRTSMVYREHIRDLIAMVRRLQSAPRTGEGLPEPEQSPSPNRYGVDTAYFRAELARLSGTLDNRPADELARYLRTLAYAAEPSPGAKEGPKPAEGAGLQMEILAHFLGRIREASAGHSYLAELLDGADSALRTLASQPQHQEGGTNG